MQIIDERPVYSATDLVGFLECEHLTDLELGALAVPPRIERPERADPELDRIRKRGEQHEERYLATLEGDGRTVTHLKLPKDLTPKQDVVGGFIMKDTIIIKTSSR